MSESLSQWGHFSPVTKRGTTGMSKPSTTRLIASLIEPRLLAAFLLVERRKQILDAGVRYAAMRACSSAYRASAVAVT
jgi:hypothetical protein